MNPTHAELSPTPGSLPVDPEVGDAVRRTWAKDDLERWAPWDGLADEQGPISAFGPVRANGKGGLLMDQAERDARRDAIRRALKVIPLITDETDDDEVWEKASGRFEGLVD